MNEGLIVVTGANGQLGQEFQRLAANYSDFEFLFTSSRELDITDREACSTFFAKYNPEVVINCAAYTRVDQAEEESEMAFMVNDSGAANIAAAARNHDSFMVHFSTDYVYKDGLNRPLKESDDCEPQSVYGQSKLAGEKSIRKSGANHVIFRVSWMYSKFGHNFLKTMMKLGADRDVISVVNDQHGTPTYARDIAETTFRIIEQCKRKQYLHQSIYNYSNLGQTTWWEFAIEIFRLTGIHCEVRGVGSDEYETRAKRPRWSVLSKEKIEREYGLHIPPWKESLAACLEEIERIN
jgi:dTDP-4-dehydrorhamnose reductase